ncbi:hypothetical protein AAHE18_18G102100 [Arachis hypogaea]
MMRFIYTGSTEITLDIAQDLLQTADQYLLEGLKRLCEYTIAKLKRCKIICKETRGPTQTCHKF